jgi:hypothetical protein
MKQNERERIITELLAEAEKQFFAVSDKIPQNWDGVELRWWMQLHFMGISVSDRQRYRAFINDMRVFNL